jgi:hypothetical protein
MAVETGYRSRFSPKGVVQDAGGSADIVTT